jgi:tetratricopeptide (TPR) repeat protein
MGRAWAAGALAILLTATAISGAWPSPARAQSAAELIDQGVAAAGRQEYQSALDHFEQAAKANGYTPEVLFDLGLASANIPGHEVRAMAWFEAYLEAAPDAGNAAAVRAQIEALRGLFETRTGGILDQLAPLLRQYRDYPGLVHTSLVSDSELARIRQAAYVEAASNLAKCWFLLGDATRAESILRTGGAGDWRARMQGLRKLTPAEATPDARRSVLIAIAEDGVFLSGRTFDTDIPGFINDWENHKAAEDFGMREVGLQATAEAMAKLMVEYWTVRTPPHR